MKRLSPKRHKRTRRITEEQAFKQYREKQKKVLERECINLWQEIVKRKALYKCEITQARGVTHSHHIFHRANYPILRYNTLNGACLSAGQHFKAHQQGEASLIAELIKQRGVEWFNKLMSIRIAGEVAGFQWNVENLTEQRERLENELKELL